MLFCPKCGSLLKPKSEKSKKILYCSCGFSTKDIQGAEIKEIIKEKKKEINVVKEEEKVHPLTDTECPKCGHKRAFYWMVQTRAGDEPETRFYKCEKCKHIWREYT